MSNSGYHPPDRERASLGEITALWRQITALIRRPADERARLLAQLGVEPDAQRHIDELLERLGRVRVPEPGSVIDAGGCDLGWQPSVLAPVFYGFSDLGTADGLPGRVRVFFPSTDGSPQNAQILTGCGRYPLVVFLHGQCVQPNRFLLWDLAPSQLARSGYVVAVPELSNNPPFGNEANNADVALVEQVLLWMRTQWPHAAALMPRVMTAVVGHSWGALLAGIVARRLQGQNAVSAYASFSGGWLEWPSVPTPPLPFLNMPALLVWGTGSSDLFSVLDQAPALTPPGAMHKVVIRGGEHWDYLAPGASTCEMFRGPCGLMRSLAADFLATFLSHYMPPEQWTLLNSTIPHTLLPPPFNLTEQQEFFAGGHLQGFSSIGSSRDCHVTHTWQLPPFAGGSITLGGA